MGHWIKNCPLNADHHSSHAEVKRSTGIPRSFIDGTYYFYLHSQFKTIYISNTFNSHLAGNSPAIEPVNLPPIEKKQEIPDDLICSICKDLFTDAVMIPCCGSSFCDECKKNVTLLNILTNFISIIKIKICCFQLQLGVRTALLESEDNECPDCNEKGSSPGSLIPNRFLRNSVNSFKNETGYNKPRQPKSELLDIL